MTNSVKLAVIGHPITHSKSPVIHNYWIKRYGLKGQYDAVDLAPEDFKDGIKKLVEQGYRGFNLTVPHKEAGLNVCDEVDDLATKIGAVNTIRVVNGKLYGTNTDAFGFTENIRHNMPGFKFENGPVVVIGAGGAAKAVAYAALHEGAPSITIVNRTIERAQDLAKMDPGRIKVMKWSERSEALDQARLVVNTTSLGMKGQEPLTIDMRMLSQAALVTDLVYNPLQTDFLQKAKARGNRTVTGIGMLLHQARPAFQGWFGVLPDAEDALLKMVLE